MKNKQITKNKQCEEPKKTDGPSIVIKSYDKELNIYAENKEIECETELTKIMGDRNINRKGFEIKIDMISDDIDNLKKKLHLLAWLRED
jgi:hypothetical protein